MSLNSNNEELNNILEIARNLPLAGEGGGGSGIIDVTELPTENIDENAIYRITTQIEDPPLDLWVVMPEGVMSLRTEMGASGTIYTYTVSELPVDMEVFDMSNNIMPVYIVEDTGIAYMNVKDVGIVTAGTMFFSTEGLDKGWIDDPYSIDLSNEANYGIYTTRAVLKDFIRLYTYKNSEWEEKTAYINYNGTPKALSGEYATDGVIEIKQSQAEVDVTQHIIQNGTIPSIVVNAPSTSDLLYGFIEEVTEDFFPTGYTSSSIFRFGAFAGCSSLRSVYFPDIVDSISNYAFYDCHSLVLTELPDRIKYIGDYAFNQCSNISLTKLPSSLEIIGRSAFYQCSNITISEIPDGVTDIYPYTFADCNSISNLTIGSSIRNIYNEAFYICSGLTSVTFKPLNNADKPFLGDNVFGGCQNLTTINVPWAEGEVLYAPWGATNATINYNYTGE